MNRTRLFGRPLLVLALGLLASGLATSSGAFTLLTDRVYKMSTGDPAPAEALSESANRPRYSVSDDGCWVVFTSTARNLVAGQDDTNGATDVFLYDACAFPFTVTIVSHFPGKATQAANGASDQPVISPDGSFVVFRSTASDIVPGCCYAGQTNIFLWERATDTFLLASHGTGGPTDAGDGNSQNGVISRNPGRPLVAFESLARNLHPSDTNDVSDVFRFDSNTGEVFLVSLPSNLPAPADGGSFKPAINGPGTCIVFESLARNLVSDTILDDTNNARDVFRWLLAGEPSALILLSHRAGAPNQGTGAQTGDGESTEASIADNCEQFAFMSTAKDLTATQNDGNGVTDVFRAGNGGDAALVSHRDGAPSDAGSDASGSPILSRNGNWIAYASLAKDLAPGQNDTGTPSSDVFLYDITKDTNTLVSHAAGDPKTVAGAESFSPEINNDGRYVAFESFAKDLDPNQNDGNGKRDVFLYNRFWNSSVLASPRYASIAIAGKEESFRPALSGGLPGSQGLTVAFTSASADLVADDLEVGGLADAFVFKVNGFFPFMSVRSTGTANVVEWVTPPVDYVSQQLFVNPGTTCPATYAAAGVLLSSSTPPANSTAQFADPTPYAPATDNCYSIFAERDSGPILSTDGPSRTIVARTLEAATGPVQWASTIAGGFTALAQVGLGGQNLVAVAQDGGVYGIGRGPTGGFWSSGFRPFRTNFSPIQGRPPVLGLSVLGSTRTTFVGSQDGRVYAYDADKGAGVGVGGALWYTTPFLGSPVQAGVAGMFIGFGGNADHLLIGTRNSSGSSSFVALDPQTGTQKIGSPFTGGSTIGLISTTASVDYTLRQVYFGSRELTAGVDPSLWCLQLTTDGLGSTCWTPQTLPAGISGGPIERNRVLYVGDDTGQVWAFEADTGVLRWGPSTLCGGASGVKSFVLADRLGTAQDLYYSTNLALCAITDTGASPTFKWAIDVATIPGPSAPLLARIGGKAYVYVGSTNGRLYEIEADNSAAIKSVLLSAVGQVGAVGFDVRDNMLYAGTDAGAIYAVQAPLVP